jgi:hypothetical protein
MSDVTSMEEMLRELGHINGYAVSLIEEAYQIDEKRIWQENLERKPHGYDWHTSFHASEFPGDDPMSCARKALYTMMDVPSSGPFEPAGRAIMDAGLDAERQLVRRLYRSGLLIGGDPDKGNQVGFVNKELWFTGNCDAPILPPGSFAPEIWDFKGTDRDKLEKLKSGELEPSEKYLKQIKAYVGLAWLQHKLDEQSDSSIWRWCWRCVDCDCLAFTDRPCPLHPGSTFYRQELDPCVKGSVIYFDRSQPLRAWNRGGMVEFEVSLDKKFMQKGLATLLVWRNSFIEDTLPARLKQWKWTEPPCKWCDWKKLCKADTKADVDKLSNSNVIAAAKQINPKYSYDDARDRVLKRWDAGT